MQIDTIANMDAVAYLQTLPDESVNCVVSSPPYFRLRDYKIDGQIGLEDTPQAYIARLIAVFDEVKRVLRNDGTIWVNLGDSYNGSGKGQTVSDKSLIPLRDEQIGKGTFVDGLGAKQLLGIPFRFAFAMQDAGWVLRSDIIWHKPSCMPESVKDRPTKSHEYVFLFAKQTRYYYDADAIAEPILDASIERLGRGNSESHKNITGAPGQTKHTMHNARLNVKLTGGNFSQKTAGAQLNHGGESNRKVYTTRNKRSVWSITHDGYNGSHFATMPTELVRNCILAGCPKGGIVLDPFMGAGTVGLVAKRLDRHYIGCDLNPDYCQLANERIAQDNPFEAKVSGDTMQLSLF